MDDEIPCYRIYEMTLTFGGCPGYLSIDMDDSASVLHFNRTEALRLLEVLKKHEGLIRSWSNEP